MPAVEEQRRGNTIGGLVIDWVVKIVVVIAVALSACSVLVHTVAMGVAAASGVAALTLIQPHKTLAWTTIPSGSKKQLHSKLDGDCFRDKQVAVIRDKSGTTALGRNSRLPEAPVKTALTKHLTFLTERVGNDRNQKCKCLENSGLRCNHMQVV